MATVFLSYRRQDSVANAFRIYDRLRPHFGDGEVFIDEGEIPIGVDFRDHLHAKVQECRILLALIGPGWAGDSGGRRRIDDPRDWVRLELEAAIARSIPLIPVLIGRAEMPSEAELPPSLAALAYRHALVVDQGLDFHHHINRLIQGIEYHLKPTATISAEPLKPTANAGVQLREFTNSLGMTMVRIERGEFLMGSTTGQIDLLLKDFFDTKREWFDDELPQHPVEVTKPFYLAAHPVAVGQYKRFVEASGYNAGEGWRTPGIDQGEDHPVVHVSHNDVLAFVGWLNHQEGGGTRVYRLPTEAEWEYACRAGGKGLYGSGDDRRELERVAWIDKNSGGTTHAVGQKEKNRFGLYDMLGNVWEWCEDFYAVDYYKNAPSKDPHSTAEAYYRVSRGGSWRFYPGGCRPALRFRYEPGFRLDNLGFRLAADQQ
jgi:formylglycine-generating enzyme required for sulfatase activity